MTWLCGPQPVNVWLFHLPKQVRETPGDVMIGGASTAAVRRASACLADVWHSKPCSRLSSTTPAFRLLCHPLGATAVYTLAYRLWTSRSFRVYRVLFLYLIKCVWLIVPLHRNSGGARISRRSLRRQLERA